jgi:hypothetical protein
VFYHYTAGQVVFDGSAHGGGGRGNPSFGDLGTGTPVNVVFDAAVPSRSWLGDPTADVSNNWLFVIMSTFAAWFSLSRVWPQLSDLVKRAE